MGPILQVCDLSKNYGDFSLSNIDFSLPCGSIMGLIGENGAGKTTTLKLILNLIHRDAGQVLLFGKDNRQGEKQLKQDIGGVFEESYFHATLTAKGIDTICRNIYSRWDSSLFWRYIREFSLPREKTLSAFSRGMRMKLSIATALAHRPRLLLLDEATSGLDPVVRSELLDLFLDFIQDEECSILLSSHITTDLEQVADYITYLHRGKVLFSREKDDLMQNYGVLKCGADAFLKVDPGDVLSVRRSAFEVQALVADRSKIGAKYRGLLVEPATLDEIMVFYSRGEVR